MISTRLLERLHARGSRLILDFVPNHTSDQHARFQESRSSRANPKRDWYVWADPRPDDGPPNNWLSRFGGSALRWDSTEKAGFTSGEPWLPIGENVAECNVATQRQDE